MSIGVELNYNWVLYAPNLFFMLMRSTVPAQQQCVGSRKCNNKYQFYFLSLTWIDANKTNTFHDAEFDLNSIWIEHKLIVVFSISRLETFIRDNTMNSLFGTFWNCRSQFDWMTSMSFFFNRSIASESTIFFIYWNARCESLRRFSGVARTTSS